MCISKTVKLIVFSVLLLVFIISLSYGGILLENHLLNRGVLVYSDNLLNTEIQAPANVDSLTKFLKFAEEENVYYVNPLNIGENPKTIKNSYKYRAFNDEKLNFALTTSLSYAESEAFSDIGVTIINNPKESVLFRINERRDYSNYEKKSLGIERSKVSQIAFDGKRSVVKSSVRNTNNFFYEAFLKKGEYNLVITLVMPLGEEYDFNVLETQCIEMVDYISGLVQRGKTNYQCGKFYTNLSNDNFIIIKAFDDEKVTIDFNGIVDGERISFENERVLYQINDEGELFFYMNVDKKTIEFTLNLEGEYFVVDNIYYYKEYR